MDNWYTTAAVDDNGNTIIVTGRLDVASYRSRERNNIRVEVTMPYTPDGPLGFPDEPTSQLLEDATEAMMKALKGKNAAMLTGIFTGAGQRNWVFYTFSTDVFGSFLNRALANMPLLPLSIYAENDPEWAAYDEMLAEAGPAGDDDDDDDLLL